VPRPAGSLVIPAREHGIWVNCQLGSQVADLTRGNDEWVAEKGRGASVQEGSRASLHRGLGILRCDS
jgi:hypothetical protein